ncbi:ferredoxin reductase family protein [Indibacter alkaliphilus]|uniref:ferredoxin reductase family protein n=1 Tax=Indibacter alkaliphilus TaxID=579922 RepID=UPI0002823EFB|nr:ferric reductase-like transmembrane domain-containing protein [Indibacter alkaliphilus]
MSTKTKRYSAGKGLIWLFIFLALSLLPLLVAYSGDIPTKRTLLEELGVVLGFIGLGLFGIQFLFSGRIKQVAPSFGVDNIVQFHKEIGIVAIIFVLSHPILLLVSDWEYISFYDPRENLPRAAALFFATFGMIALLSTSLWRVSTGLNYEWWRLIHGVLGFSLVFIGIVHSIQVGHYLNEFYKIAFFILFFGSLVYLLVHARMVRPYMAKKDPFIIKEILPRKDDCYTLRLEKKSAEPFRFLPGQFTWITISHTPFSLQQHPFSFSSSAENSILEITAKRIGDFTNTWKYLQPGQTAFLEGPFGSFTLKEKPCFLVMGGIGVTPGISFLKTLADRKDQRKCILIYGNESWKKIPFREELDRLKNQINLKLIHVLEKPDKDWDGEKGLIDEKLVTKYLPEDLNEFDYYICGPGQMMDKAELTFRKQGVDWRNIYAERFDFV